jgi:hypothetical protein
MLTEVTYLVVFKDRVLGTRIELKYSFSCLKLSNDHYVCSIHYRNLKFTKTENSSVEVTMDQTETGKKSVQNFGGRTSKTGVTEKADEMGRYY